jgi:uncharacterized protein YdcH (DUF465 family)
MSSVTLLHPEETFKIPALQVMNKCSLFQNDSPFLVSPYRVQSSVSLFIFREFLSALEGNAINITDMNFTELHRLCNEFGFTKLAANLSNFRPSIDFKEEAEDADARGRIAALEEKANQHSHIIAMLQDKVSQLSTDVGRLVGEVSALRSASAGIQTLLEEVSALKTQITQKQSDSVVEQLSTDFSELRKDVLTLKSQIAAIPSVFDSRIISGFLEIFAEFQKKQFSLLWRGSRDGFKLKEFHRRCDGHENTLTVILDTKGNIFGGFTPVEWESRVWNGQYGNENNTRKADDSQKTFIFTLKNPHNIPVRRFALKAQEKYRAIVCDSEEGPWFNFAIRIRDNCDLRADNFGCLGTGYTNDTGLDDEIVFTGSECFQVEEIEVFEITG